jgi:hypothetical protein
MNSKDARITEILARYEESFADSVWRVQGNAVIYHKALERIATKAGIWFDAPQVLVAQPEAAAILVTGHMGSKDGDREAWSIGEAVVNLNYRVSGKQAAYPFAMAEKRAKDRVILKLLELSGDVYSEEEADEFRRGRQEEPTVYEGPLTFSVDPLTNIERDLKAAIRKAKTVNAVTDFMLQPTTQTQLKGLTEEGQLEMRDYAKARLVELGWPSKRKA